MTHLTFNVITNMRVINSLVPCCSSCLLCLFTLLYKKMRQRGSRNSASNRTNSTEGQSGAGCLSKAALQGLQSECAAVWFDRAAFERAESLYHIRLLERQNGSMTPTSSSPKNEDACHHGDQAAVRVNKASFHHAERRFTERSLDQPIAPRSLQLHPSQPPCDEGYQSQTPTPPTPASRPINGTSSSLMGVWLQKPLYDNAETSYYQNLYASNVPKPENNNKRSNSKRRNGAGAKKAKSAACNQQNCDDVPTGNGGVRYNFLHADSERVWLDRGCYAEVETRFHDGTAARTVKMSRNDSSGSRKKMSVSDCFAQERIWFDKPRYDEAERQFYERLNGPAQQKQDTGANMILQDIARARENIQKSLAGSGGPSAADYGELTARLKSLELENQSLHKVVGGLRSALSKMESRVSVLEKRTTTPTVNGTATVHKSTPAPQKAAAAPVKEDDEDDIDLFGSDEEVDEEAERLKEQRLQEYATKKAKKPALIAKSSILLDVKPWDDETNMSTLEECVRSVQVDGLLWGASKLVPVGYGIKKLQINCVVEDDKVGTDFLEEEITKFEDYIQSVDVAAFNKI
ncbi:eukaryotic translation elongation factor 1 delta b (guanine nucleotide exchange protein) isoform X2 [Triplophysa dalaica]|uniref:eukaryotic translation elongation factor 1 delta b (guanine nucleotide exchange protein) isoform X2 n=1 Tax=Triplophysa dalaica TaxID=1582913 RepID=UPI0024DFABD2|nr:eukaryotic translation elongation factor 1 delta b (guanine nucleotide exchange protein) isoform X2 [Triplophysa dalaica]